MDERGERGWHKAFRSSGLQVFRSSGLQVFGASGLHRFLDVTDEVVRRR
jgi:hypothetical protein